MSKHAYSRTVMLRIALTLTDDELFRNYKIANQDTHKCNHCFNCVCKELYLNLMSVRDIALDKELWGS